jgi:hypothetical protein
MGRIKTEENRSSTARARIAGAPATTRMGPVAAKPLAARPARAGNCFFWLSLPILLGSVVLAGCSSNANKGSGNTGSGGYTPFPSDYITASGNWQFTPTATTGVLPFTSLAGYINEEKTSYGYDLTTAVLQVQPSSASNCFADATVIPMDGHTTVVNVYLASFTDEQQVLSLQGTKNSAVNQLSGKYSISSGCASNLSGTIVGTEYADVNGTFAGALTNNPNQSATLSLTQYTTGTGDGVFLLSGTGTFNGFGCFSSGTLAAQNGGVLGNTITMNFSTNDVSGARAVLTGTINPSASTITLKSFNVVGGSCPASFGGGVLNLQT